MLTHLLFVCEQCENVATIHKVAVAPDCKVIIYGSCDTCEDSFTRNYDLAEIFVAQEEAA